MPSTKRLASSLRRRADASFVPAAATRAASPTEVSPSKEVPGAYAYSLAGARRRGRLRDRRIGTITPDVRHAAVSAVPVFLSGAATELLQRSATLRAAPIRAATVC